jgi:hypothetical protein
MIHRIRELAASLHDDIADDLHGFGPQEDITEEDDDPGLDLLVKNAVRTNWLEHDPRRVWKQLSERVRGPFGQMAVEQPAMAGQQMPVAYEGHEATDYSPETMRHRYFRLSDSIIPQR